MIVSSGAVKHGHTWSGRAQHRKVLGAMVVVLLVVGSFMIYRGVKKEEPVVSTPTCSDKIINKGASAVEPSQVERLEPVANQIKQIPNLQDPDCLYLLTIYYVNMSDPQNAADTFAKLEQAYDTEVGYDRSLESVAETPKELRHKVVFLKKYTPKPKEIGPDGAPR